MSTMERVRVNVGRFAYCCVALVFASFAVAALWRGDLRVAGVCGIFAGSVLYCIAVSRFAPWWEDELRLPPSGIRTTVEVAIWLAIGCVFIIPDLLNPGARVEGDSSWAWWIVVGYFALPAVALLHLELFSGLGRLERAKNRWSIGRLGPVGAVAYFVIRGSATLGRDGRRTRG